MSSHLFVLNVTSEPCSIRSYFLWRSLRSVCASYLSLKVLRQELRDLRQAASASSGKPVVDLGNNFGGDRGGFLDKILRRIARP